MKIVREKALPHLVVPALLLFLSLLFLWPLPVNGTTHIIGGVGDPLLELWTLCWNDHWFSGQAPSYFDANICHPEKNSLAFADHLFSQALIFAPLHRITGNPVLSYNLLLALSLAISGWGAYLCAGALGLSRPVSLVVGILFAFFPFRTSQVKHLHILSTQWLPFSFYFLLSFLRSKTISWRHLSLFTLFSVLHTLCSYYQALIWALLISITVITFVIGGGISWRKAIGLFCAGLVIFTVLAPFSVAYFQVSQHYDFVRSINENERFSAHPDDFVHASHRSLLYRSFIRLTDMETSPGHRSGEHQLYPGLVFLVLLTGGIVLFFRHGDPVRKGIPPAAAEVKREQRYSRLVWLALLATTLAAIVCAFGPVLVLGTGDDKTVLPLPYSLLYHWLPGIQGLRVPARLVLLFHFSGSLLAGLGLNYYLAGKTRTRTWATVLLLSALVFLESVSFNLPNRSLPRPATIPDAYREIGRMPGDTVLLELPTHAFSNQFLSMYNSTLHFRPLANGRSGLIPPLTREMNRLTHPDNQFAFGPALLEHMLDTGINTVLLHGSWNEQRINQLTLRRLHGLGCFKVVGRFDDHDILLRLAARAGDEDDVQALHGVPMAPLPGERIPLKAADAYPSNQNRALQMEVRGDTLRLGEQLYLCWFSHLPRGRWQLRLRASGLDRSENGSRPVVLSAKIAGHHVLEGMSIGETKNIQTVPVNIGKAGYYRINIFVRPEQPGTMMSIDLDRLRFVPLSAEEIEPVTRDAISDKQNGSDSRTIR